VRTLALANVLLAGDGTPKITDFGLAKKLDESGQTQEGAIMGTPSYMAPEVQAALADGDHLRLAGQVAELLQGARGPISGVVRMHSRRGGHRARMSAGQGEPSLAALGRGAGGGEPRQRHPGADAGLAIRLERAVRQFHPDTRRESAVHLRVLMRLRGLVPGHQ
jgi:serine/threonine-protein kinase